MPSHMLVCLYMLNTEENHYIFLDFSTEKLILSLLCKWNLFLDLLKLMAIFQVFPALVRAVAVDICYREGGRKEGAFFCSQEKSLTRL